MTLAEPMTNAPRSTSEPMFTGSTALAIENAVLREQLKQEAGAIGWRSGELGEKCTTLVHVFCGTARSCICGQFGDAWSVNSRATLEQQRQRIAALEAELSRSCVNPDCGMGVGDKPTCGKCVWCEKAKLEAERDAARAERDEAVKVEPDSVNQFGRRLIGELQKQFGETCTLSDIMTGYEQSWDVDITRVARALRAARGETQGGT